LRGVLSGALGIQFMSWDVSLHVYGESFKPSAVDFHFSEAIDVGTLGVKGKFKNIPMPFGHATIHASESNASGRSILAVCEIGLSLMDTLKTAGTNEFVLWVLRDYESQCNEEFRPEEISLMAKVGCTLCYSAYQGEKRQNS
jgi:hypothetical protein